MTTRVLILVAAECDSGNVRQAAVLAQKLPPEFDVRVGLLSMRGGRGGEPASWKSLPADRTRRFTCRHNCDLGVAWQIRRWVGDWQPEIIHGWDATAAGYASLVLSRTQRLIVSLRRDGTPRKWIGSELLARRAAHTTLVVASEAMWPSVQGWRADAAVHIPLGVETGSSHPGDAAEALHEELELPADAIIVACVGAATRHHDWQTALWAFEVLCAVHKQSHLLLFGEGPRLQADAGFANSLLRADQAHFMGSRAMEPVWPAIQLLVQPGSQPGVSVAVLEAMARGVPVIASDVAGVREYVEHGKTGMLTPPGDRIAISRAAYKLLQDRAMMSAMAERGRRFVEAKFSAQTMAERYAALYRRAQQGAPA